MSSGKLYGNDTFDPKYIISQILVLQAGYYTILFTLGYILSGVFGVHPHIEQVFSEAPLDYQDSYGFVYVLMTCLSVPAVSAEIIIVIERTHKCLDFTATIYVIHLICVWLSYGFPVNVVWWIVNLAALSVTVLLSEFICMKIEQKAIILPFKSSHKEKT